MICSNCQYKMTDNMKFCPCCGKPINNKDSCKYFTKEDIDKIYFEKDYEKLWSAILSGSVYAEYVYEMHITAEIKKVKIPDDFNEIIQPVLEYKNKENAFAEYLYYYCLMITFRERGLVSGLSSLLADRKKYEEGIQGLIGCFLTNQPSAMYRGAICYFEGLYDFEKNEIKAFKLLQQAAKAKHPGALLKMAEIYEKGMTGIKINSDKSRKYRQMAAFWGVSDDNTPFSEKNIDENDISELTDFYSLQILKNKLERPFNEERHDEAINEELINALINKLQSIKSRNEKSAEQQKGYSSNATDISNNNKEIKADSLKSFTANDDTQTLINQLNDAFVYENDIVSDQCIDEILNDPAANYLGIENRRHTYEENMDMAEQLFAEIEKNGVVISQAVQLEKEDLNSNDRIIQPSAVMQPTSSSEHGAIQESTMQNVSYNYTPTTTNVEKESLSNEIPNTIKGKAGLVIRLLFLLIFIFMTILSFVERPVCGIIALFGAAIMCPVGLKKVRDKVPGLVQVILSFILIIVSISMYPDDSAKTSESSDLKSADQSVQETVVTTETIIDHSENEIITETQTTTVTTTEVTTTTTPTTTEATTTTTAKPVDAVENDYEVFETVLFVHVDEADTLPLRDKPNRDTSSVITRIPDKTRVDVLGYKDTGSEIWFRLDYDGTKGWARGGMLQPKNLNDIWTEEYDLPGMDKWRSKFILDEEYKINSREVYANFQGTLYFQPDLSSGVQKRFKSPVFVRVYGVSYDSSDWYYVGTGDAALESEGFGWVHSSQLSW